MKTDRRPLRKIEKLFDNLAVARVLTTLDLYIVKWQVRLPEEFKVMTKFVCRYGTNNFKVMSFRGMDAPSTFQKMVESVL